MELRVSANLVAERSRAVGLGKGRLERVVKNRGIARDRIGELPKATGGAEILPVFLTDRRVPNAQTGVKGARGPESENDRALIGRDRIRRRAKLGIKSVVARSRIGLPTRGRESKQGHPDHQMQGHPCSCHFLSYLLGASRSSMPMSGLSFSRS